MSNSPRTRWLALAGFLAVTFAGAGVSGAITASAIPTWYAGLTKPSFNPPNEVFAPVWTLLYALMAVAAWLVWCRPQSQARLRALQLFGIQLLLNFAWSWLFFGLHSLGGALACIGLLWLAIFLTMQSFFPESRVAGAMLVPYLAWVSFASALNFEIWRLN